MYIIFQRRMRERERKKDSKVSISYLEIRGALINRIINDGILMIKGTLNEFAKFNEF